MPSATAEPPPVTPTQWVALLRVSSTRIGESATNREPPSGA
jgi:hypothetical protein